MTHTHNAAKLCHHYTLFALCDTGNIQYEELPLQKKELAHILLTPGQSRCIKPKL